MKKGGVLLVFLSFLLLITACGRRSEEAISDNLFDYISINYDQSIGELEEVIKDRLNYIGLDFEENIISQNKEEGEERVGIYKFNWTTNNHKLEIPLFGDKGQLLPYIKDEIIEELEQIFPLIDVSWEDNEDDQFRRLKVDLSFSAQNRGLDVLAHSIEFIQERPKAKMAIVIDDLGYDWSGIDKMVNINRPLTMAVLPYPPYAVSQAQMAKAKGHELILHQPLEPLNPEVDPGGGAILEDMSEEEIKETLIENLESLPPMVGINHHMGSKGSADQRIMAHIMEVLKEKGLYYIDSSTSNKSVGASTARKYGVPTGTNYLFLDNIDDKEEIMKMLDGLAKIALRRGELITIGHVKTNTALAIEEMIPKLEEMGIKLVYGSQLVR
ncbi:divergent polysaccharide deacetylase family protein [Halonatronum saccharophilum]|uniref:divergent polysaccharide deacetylase family protein n=1 Tax=Halonatronum saccharophilum TaxID=150060 RepID=UPI0004808C17|nr:divergent polysaccharide deacetylase family protein [Halonatronum saccharophilum]